MEIIIEKLKIVNFKGIKDREVSFDHRNTCIYGDNATGKTTIFDSFSWLFHGKNSIDQKDFKIKRQDKNGNTIEKVDTEVSAIIRIDGKKTEIRKVLHEKWQKKRGEINPTFVGNENLYFWNDVPLQLQQFQEKINEIINEDVFKLITNTLYYNSLNWQKRREILVEIGGEPSNEELIAINPEFRNLVEMLGDKKFTEFKNEIAAKKKKLKDQLATIPTRIDEINRSKPEEENWTLVRFELDKATEVLNTVEQSLEDANKAARASNDLFREKQNSIYQFKSQIDNIQNDIRNQYSKKSIEMAGNISELERSVSSLLNEKKFKQQSIDQAQSNLEILENDRKALGEEWTTENAKTIHFEDGEFKCPTCDEPFKADKVEEKKKQMTENFNKNKAQQLARINNNGSLLKLRIEKLTTQLSADKKSIVDLEKKIISSNEKLQSLKSERQKFIADAEIQFNKAVAENKDIQDKKKSIEALEEELNVKSDTTDNSALINRKNELKQTIDKLKIRLINQDLIKRIDDRVKELKEEEENYSQQLVELEGKEYLAEQFNKTKMETLVNKVNSKFKYVTFKMFEQQINGGEKDCCETLVPGPTGLVPFSDANNAARINAGLDIINTLCDHYRVYAPIFIDNRESVNKLIECNSQIINLIVSKDQELRIA